MFVKKNGGFLNAILLQDKKTLLKVELENMSLKTSIENNLYNDKSGISLLFGVLFIAFVAIYLKIC